MKRILLTLSAAALVLTLGAIAFADDTPATTPAAVAPAPAADAKPMHHAHHHRDATTAAAAAIDLNSATKEQLMTLPGIDDATAEKIIAARPFTKRADLISKSVVTKEEYSKIRSKVMARKAS